MPSRRIADYFRLFLVGWICAAIGSSSIRVNGNATAVATFVAAAEIDNEKFERIDEEVLKAISQRQLPGAVVAIGYGGQLQSLKAYGNRQHEPTIEPMTTDTIFDLASLTKPIVTACCVMKLVDEGKLSLADPVAKHLPEFAAKDKHSITIKQLMLHTSGLIPDNSMNDYAMGREMALQNVMQLPLSYPTDTRFRYSDVGFIVLGHLVERVSGQSLDVFSRDRFFAPLRMRDTAYNPNAAFLQRIAPTGKRNGEWIRGEVHDPRAFAMEGIAGHAGLFSTASDLAVFSQMLLNNGTLNGHSVLTSNAVAQMTNSYQVPEGVRSLGWDKRSPYSSNRGTTMSDKAFGHGGFTGTGIWIDPNLDLYVIFLCNRLHLSERTAVNSLIGRVGTLAADVARTHAGLERK
jgi:CubicO group peptidase (beta-lactamase class C family)